MKIMGCLNRSWILDSYDSLHTVKLINVQGKCLDIKVHSISIWMYGHCVTSKT